MRQPAVLEADSLTATLSGVGSLRVGGRVTTQTVNLNGVGNVDHRDLHSVEAEVVVSGPSSTTVRVSDRLLVSFSGPGSVFYIGDPVVSISGSGNVAKIDE